MKGWECPKCGRVWGPTVIQCSPCNVKAETGRPVPVGPLKLGGPSQ